MEKESSLAKIISVVTLIGTVVQGFWGQLQPNGGFMLDAHVTALLGVAFSLCLWWWYRTDVLVNTAAIEMLTTTTKQLLAKAEATKQTALDALKKIEAQAKSNADNYSVRQAWEAERKAEIVKEVLVKLQEQR